MSAFSRASLVIYIAAGCAAGSRLVHGRRDVTPAYSGPYQALTPTDWNYHDHGVSWKQGECRSGMNQSPIALPTEAENDDANLFFRYKELAHQVELFNDGTSLSVTLMQDCIGGFGVGRVEGLELGAPLELDEKYILVDVVFHSPSEHTWGGQHVPLEVQLVHRSSEESDKLGVISIGFQHGGPEVEHHAFLAALLEEPLPKEVNTGSMVNKVMPHVLDFGQLIGDNKTFFKYSGSMTIPSCKTNVKWFVRKDFQEAPQEQINQFYQHIQTMTEGTGNNRVIHDLMNRSVTLMRTVDASAMQTLKERHPTNTAAPTMDLRHGDEEDAVQVAPSAPGADDEDELAKEKEERAEFRSTDPDSIIAAFNHSTIMDNSGVVTDADPYVRAAREEVMVKEQAYDEAETQVGHACDGVEDAEKQAEVSYGSPVMEAVAGAKRKGCGAAKEVSKKVQLELNISKTNLEHYLAINQEGIMGAKKIIRKIRWREANQTSAGPDEKTMIPVPHGTTSTEYVVPDKASLDPFVLDCAESSSRINGHHPTMAQHLMPNLEQPADVQGIHSVEEEEEEPKAPTEGSPDEEEDVDALLGMKSHVRPGAFRGRRSFVSYSSVTSF